MAGTRFWKPPFVSFEGNTEGKNRIFGLKSTQHRMPWNELLSLLGALQGVLLAALLLARAHRRRANGILALFVLFFSVSLTEKFYAETLPAYAVEALGGLVFLYGPLLFFYVKILFGDAVPSRSFLRHGLPFAVYQVALAAAKAGRMLENDLLDFILINGYFCHLLGYSYASLRRILVEKHRASADTLSPIRWLLALTGLLTGVYLLAFLTTYLLAFGVPGSALFLKIIQVACVVVVYALSYRALAQPDESGAGREAERYHASPLTDPAKNAYLDQIQRHVAAHRPYLRADLTLDQFAREVGLSRLYVSQVINERLGKNFSDFINGYRVSEAQRLLADPRKAHYSVLGVAFEAGFNSKTAFNAAFKKLTGQRPSEYRKGVNEAMKIAHQP